MKDYSQEEINNAIIANARQSGKTELNRPFIRILSNDSQQNIAKLRASFGLPHSFIIPRLDKKGRPVK